MAGDDRYMSALSHAERASSLSLAIHSLLQDSGQAALADIVWVAHLEARDAAEDLGSALGLEPSTE